MKRPELETEAYIKADGGLIPFSSLSNAQKKECISRLVKNASERMSDFYRQHPDRVPSSAIEPPDHEVQVAGKGEPEQVGDLQKSRRTADSAEKYDHIHHQKPQEQEP